MDDFFEYHGIYVLAEHVEQEPVTHLRLLYDDVDALLLDEAEPYEKEVGSHAGRDYDDEAVEDDQCRHDRQQEEVEPQEDVDLLVDYVDGQYAEGVVALNVARGAELVEGALGHAREDVDDWIDSVFVVSQCERDHFYAEGEEGPVQKAVHQEQLA